MLATTHDRLRALIFVGYLQSKLEHSPQLHQTQRSDQDLCLCRSPFLLEILVPGINGYLAGWFHVKLCAKCMLHSCYRLFLC
jgi:hypothetical protein